MKPKVRQLPIVLTFTFHDLPVFISDFCVSFWGFVGTDDAVLDCSMLQPGGFKKMGYLIRALFTHNRFPFGSFLPAWG